MQHTGAGVGPICVERKGASTYYNDVSAGGSGKPKYSSIRGLGDTLTATLTERILSRKLSLCVTLCETRPFSDDTWYVSDHCELFVTLAVPDFQFGYSAMGRPDVSLLQVTATAELRGCIAKTLARHAP